MRILIFGASVTQGLWDTHGGWVQRLAREYHSATLASMLAGGDYKVQVFNLGVSGDTAQDVTERLEPETKARTKKDEESVIVLSVGLNDARMRDNRALTDVYEFQEAYEKAIDKALKLTSRVVCVGLSAVDESKTNPSPYSANQSQWTNNRINTFEDTIKQTAERNSLPFVPIHDHFMAALESGQDLLADGLHPNEAGHQLIVELVKPVLNEACYTT